MGRKELMSILSGLGVSDQELPGTVCLACYAKKAGTDHKNSQNVPTHLPEISMFRPPRVAVLQNTDASASGRRCFRVCESF